MLRYVTEDDEIYTLRAVIALPETEPVVTVGRVKFYHVAKGTIFMIRGKYAKLEPGYYEVSGGEFLHYSSRGEVAREVALLLKGVPSTS